MRVFGFLRQSNFILAKLLVEVQPSWVGKRHIQATLEQTLHTTPVSLRAPKTNIPSERCSTRTIPCLDDLAGPTHLHASTVPESATQWQGATTPSTFTFMFPVPSLKKDTTRVTAKHPHAPCVHNHASKKNRSQPVGLSWFPSKAPCP